MKEAKFQHGDFVVIKDDTVKMTGIKRVGTVDYWIKEKSINDKGYKSFNGNYKYFLNNPDGSGKLGPFYEMELEGLK